MPTKIIVIGHLLYQLL